MLKKKLAACMAIVLGLSLLAAGCGKGDSSSGTSGSGSSSEGGGTFIIRAGGDPMSFNPVINADDNGYPIFQNIFLRLCALDSSKQNLVPEAAEEWSYNEDATVLTFKLRQDLKWTDGEALNSEDVKYTFETIKANPSYYFSSNMQNVAAVETPDDYTVIFNLTEPDASFVKLLGWYATFIVPEHIYNNGEDWADNAANSEPVSCGPFKLDEYKQGESITLVRNDDYPEPAKLDKLIFSIIPDEATALQAVKNGEIDFYENCPTSSLAELEADENLRVVINEYPSPIRMVFNVSEEKVADVAVRKAIATAIDRDEISEKVFNGVQKPEYNMYPSLIEWASNSEDTAPKFNTAGASKILEEAGYSKDANGLYVSGLTMDVFEGNGYPDTAKLIKATLEEAGIGVEIQVHEYNAWNQKVGDERDFMIELQGGFMGPDPAALATRIQTGMTFNWGSYSNTQVDELLGKGASTSDEAERAEYYKEVQKIVSEELPYVNIVSFAGPEVNSARFVNLPYDGQGKWGWADYSHVELAK